MSSNEEMWIAVLNRTPFGLELAKEVARKLEFPDPKIALKLKSRGRKSGLYVTGKEAYGHEIWFDGMSFLWVEVDASYKTLLTWNNREEFIRFLSRQSDFTCSGADPNTKEFFCRRPIGPDPFTKKVRYHALYNMPITQYRLVQFIRLY